MNWVTDPSASDLRYAHELAAQSEAAVKSLLLKLLSRSTETPRLCSEVAPIVRDAIAAAGQQVRENQNQSGMSLHMMVLIFFSNLISCSRKLR